MNGHWCDQAEIMESIAAQGRPRGCYECWPGVNRQRLWNLSCSGTPEGILWMGVAWCDQVDCRIYHYSTLELQVKESLRCYRGCYL